MIKSIVINLFKQNLAMVGNCITQSVTDHNQPVSRARKRYRIGLNAEFNLAMISGDLTGPGAVTQLEELTEHVKAHFVTSEQIHLHVQIKNIDHQTVNMLVNLIRVLNMGALLNKVVTVSWINSPDNTAISRIGQEFARTSSFAWNSHVE